MTIRTDTGMRTDPLVAELTWLHLHDSAFPSGRFVHSNGLEAWLRDRPDATDDQIRAVARAYVAGSVATLDAVAVGHAWSTPDSEALVELDLLVRAYKITESARTSSEACGRQLVTTARRTMPSVAGLGYLGHVAAGRTPGSLPVVEGALQRALGIDRSRAVAGTVRSGYAGVLSAAVRLGRLGPMQVQRALFDDVQWITDLVRAAECTPLEDVTAFSPGLDIAAMRHETSSARLFST
ncbi:urease accessory protein UreF [Dietzia sp. NCCP-2495]|uniref:urease accessory protein UreF n=1 Tax=Dietzia sp. NCCP-2495 TaxID=2934675 RepID=UPI00222E8F40|nr:urease accessory UreF family protein [Dietzia sp. NCCP-2495]